MDSDKEDQKSLERIQNLLKLVKNNILHRNKETDFDIGIGQIVKDIVIYNYHINNQLLL